MPAKTVSTERLVCLDIGGGAEGHGPGQGLRPDQLPADDAAEFAAVIAVVVAGHI